MSAEKSQPATGPMPADLATVEPQAEVAAIQHRLLQVAEEKVVVRRRELELDEESCALLKRLYDIIYLVSE